MNPGAHPLGRVGSKNHPFSPSNLPKVRIRAECISSVCAPAEAKHAEQKRQERAGIECGEDDDFTAQARDPGREGPPQSLLEEIIALPKYLGTAVAFTTAARTRVYKEATVTVATRENVSELVQLG